LRILGQLGIHSETLSQKMKQKKIKEDPSKWRDILCS
jgi:hypothetical protein